MHLRNPADSGWQKQLKQSCKNQFWCWSVSPPTTQRDVSTDVDGKFRLRADAAPFVASIQEVRLGQNSLEQLGRFGLLLNYESLGRRIISTCATWPSEYPMPRIPGVSSGCLHLSSKMRNPPNGSNGTGWTGSGLSENGRRSGIPRPRWPRWWITTSGCVAAYLRTSESVGLRWKSMKNHR